MKSDAIASDCVKQFIVRWGNLKQYVAATELWIEYSMLNGTAKSSLLHEHYYKFMANTLAIRSDSAMSSNRKTNVPMAD